MEILPLSKEHYSHVARIYKEGLATGIATFETEVPDWETWNRKFLPQCRYVMVHKGQVLGWCALSATSKREVYKGVAENTLYVSETAKGKGIGTKLLMHLISESEKEGFWTLQAGIFSQNQVSIHLHEKCGFRIIGTREKIAKRDGVWHDNVIMERRSTIM